MEVKKCITVTHDLFIGNLSNKTSKKEKALLHRTGYLMLKTKYADNKTKGISSKLFT